MKLGKIKIFAVGLVMATFTFTQYGCEGDWLDATSSTTLKNPSTATAEVNTVLDSTAMLNYSLSTVGRIYVAVVKGTDATVAPAANSILALNVSGAVFKKQIILNNPEALSGSVKITGLVQNTSYKVFALPVNEDGVLGTVVTAAAFVTADTYEPTIDITKNISPSVSNAASVDVAFKPVLTFNEPVKLADVIDIKMSYRNAVTGIITDVPVPAENIAIDGAKVTFTQPQAAINGQYVFLSIADGSILDLYGNAYEGVSSGISGGLLVGVYWRVKFAPTVAQAILPAAATADVALQIELDYMYKMRMPTTGEGGYDQKKVVVRYSSTGVSSDYEVASANVAFVNDTLVRLTLPRVPIVGEKVTFMMAEGAVRNSYGNPSAAIAFGTKTWTIQ